MKQGRHKIYRMSFLNNDVKTANLYVDRSTVLHLPSHSSRPVTCTFSGENDILRERKETGTMNQQKQVIF